jgi:hypothetical protein
MFEAPLPSVPLTQGDIVEDCPLVILDPPGAIGDEKDPPTKLWKARVVVLTQACDLVQSKSARVLVAQVHEAKSLVEQGLLKSATVRDQVRRHQVFGWYFLPAIPTPIALPESLVNLRDLFSVPRALLDNLVANGKRKARLLSPYREHLAQHFAVTYMRVALPEPYDTTPT